MSVYDVYGNPVSVYDIEGNIKKTLYRVDGTPIPYEELTPVSVHGRLRLSGNYLVDSNGKRFQLRGIGTHALLQYTNLHTFEMFKCLRDFGLNCIRISVYLSDFSFQYSEGLLYKGYISEPDATKVEIEKIVDFCVELGLYCILDWHTMQGENVSGILKYQDEAVEFFEYYAQKYADVPNVLYELQNEPYNVTQASLSSYVKAEHDAILEYIEDPIMIVGKTNINMNTMVSWIQGVGIYDVFYSTHVYGDDLSTAPVDAPTIPSMITEWSNAAENSSGGGDDPGCLVFMDKMHNRKVSNMCWKLTDQNHVFSVFKNRGHINSSYYLNGFTEDDLTDWGSLFFNKSKEYKEP